MLRIPSRRCQAKDSRCRCKMRMSGSSKVEMSASIDSRGRYGNGANCLEPIRTGPRSVLPRADSWRPATYCEKLLRRTQRDPQGQVL